MISARGFCFCNFDMQIQKRTLNFMITFLTLYYFSRKCELFGFYSFKVNWKFSQIIVCYTEDIKWNLPVKPGPLGPLCKPLLWWSILLKDCYYYYQSIKKILVLLSTHILYQICCCYYILIIWIFYRGIKFCEFKFCEDLCLRV